MPSKSSTKDSEAWNDIGVPALVEESADDLICGYHLALLRPFANGILGDYLFRALQSTGVAYQFHVEANGVTRYGLSHSAIKSIWLPFPPLPEQAAIVRFLDFADRRIGRYIRAKQKLIKLLEEEKQVVIHRAVTCGLNPNVNFKPSGVEWLGEVPEHWEMVPNRALLRLEKRLVGKASGDYLLLSLTKRGVIPRDMENPEGKFPTSFDTYQEINSGDLVFCLFDIDETPRAVGLSKLHGMITSAYTRLSCDPSVVDWVHFFYLAMDNGKRLKPLYTGLRKVITKSVFLSAKMPLPPVSERGSILAYVEASNVTAEAAIDRARREIDLLREYRTRLIADIVTGKVDIREASATLPDELEAETLEGKDVLQEEEEVSGDDEVEGSVEEVEI